MNQLFSYNQFSSSGFIFLYLEKSVKTYPMIFH